MFNNRIKIPYEGRQVNEALNYTYGSAWAWVDETTICVCHYGTDWSLPEFSDRCVRYVVHTNQDELILSQIIVD